jgi:hypothetical protein
MRELRMPQPFTMTPAAAASLLCNPFQVISHCNEILAGVLAGKKYLFDSSGSKSEHFKELFSLLDFG